MRSYKKYGRFLVASVCLSSAFLLSVKFSDRGLQLDLRQSSGALNQPEEAPYHLSALKILNSVLLHLKDSYVEPERIHPDKMLVSALEEIQNAIPEVVVSHDAIGKEQAPERVTVIVQDKRKVFEIKEIKSLWEMSFKLKEIFTFIESSLSPDPERKYQEIEYAAINGMLNTLDPHSALMPPQNYQDMQTQTGGKFGGLGIVISLRDGTLTVISPIDDTPAARKGIKSGDKIMRINDESTVNMDLSEAVNMMRGEPGTQVTLWVMREGWPEPKRYDIERAIIKIDSVDSQPLANKVGYLRIKNFQANTYTDTRRHLDALREKMGGMQGLVLDMRDNPGGLLDQSIRISDLFVDEGTLVSTVGQGNRLREKKMASTPGTEPKYPIVVLVNSGSASASEIVSGAIQNNNRGIVVGSTTFGKGSVQVLYPFPDSSALKLTVAQYLTPGGISIQGQGISPDLHTVPARVKKEEVDLFLPKHILREGELSTALKNQAIKKPTEQAQFVRYLDTTDPKEEETRDPEKFREDFEIRLAQRLLVAAGATWERPNMLKAIQPELQKAASKEQDTIQAELKKLNVDWSAGASPKQLGYKIAFTTDLEQGKPAKAGSTVKLTATLTNTSDQPVYQLKALTESDNPSFNDREFIFGKVNPNESRSWSVDIKLPRDADTRQDFITFALSDATTTFSEKDGTSVAVVAQDQPHFAFSYELEDPNGDGLLQEGELVTIKLNVRNTGKADSAETLVFIKNMSRDTVDLKSGRAKIPSIKAGAVEPVTFTFEVKKAPAQQVATMEVDIYDLTFRQFTQKKFELPFAPAQAVAKASGHAVARANAALHTGADARSSKLTTLPSGGALPVQGKVGDWVKLKLNGRSAWARLSEVELKKSASGADAKDIKPILFEKPNIKLTPAQAMTEGAVVNLKGALQDDSGLKDYYIFVYSRESNTVVHSRKVLYSSVAGAQANLDAQIPLFKGMNRIAVFARDAEGMLATESAFVYRR